MSVNLQKGQKVELCKNNGNTLRKVIVGLGWDPAERKGFFSTNIDCDASAFVCCNGRIVNQKDIICFFRKKHSSGAVRHMGDNLTGKGDGDDEQILVDLMSLPSEYDKIIFVVNIYRARQRKQHFGMIRNAFIRICDAETNQELCKYDLSEDYNNMTAMIFGEVYRYNGKWKFNAIGQPTQDNSVDDLAKRFS